jgi:transposase
VQSSYRVVPRPPYRPQDGPVEYAINQVLIGLASRWSELKEDATPGDMRVWMLDIIDNGVKGMRTVSFLWLLIIVLITIV